MEKLKNLLRHLFIPHEQNNYRAKSLHTDFLTFYLVIAFMLSLTFKYTGLENILGFATDITIEKLHQLTNNERQKSNLGNLVFNEKLSVAAQLKANDMFAKNYWAHYSPVGSTPWDFITGSGYRYEYAGENLAKNFLFSDGVVSAWMNSPTHRENILKKEYTEVGFAVVNGTLNGEQTTLVVQLFGKPADASVFSPPIAKSVTAEEKGINQLTFKKPNVLARNTDQSKSSLFNSYNINLVFFAFLLIALFFDFYYASKLRIIRFGGKNIAHFIFVLFMLLGLIISSRGKII